MKTKDHKVFISYSSLDKPIVRKIYERLKRIGLLVWIDELEIRVGQSVPVEISRALSEATLFCYVISKNSVKSNWVSRELNSILPKIISGDAWLIPCKVDATKIPMIIQDYKYADFSNDFESGVKELLNAVQIREQFLHNKFMNSLFEELNKCLTEIQINYFSYLFSKKNYFYLNETCFNNDVKRLFEELMKRKLIHIYSDDWGITYLLNSNGEEIYKLMKGCTSQEILLSIKPIIDKVIKN